MMAASTVSSTRLSELVKCPICLDYYNDPRLLPCSHTFCFACITQLARHNDKDDDSDDEEYRFVCPLKDGTSLAQHQLTDLPVNRVAQNMVELLLSSCSETDKKKENQVHCDLCTKNAGERWCPTCSQQFCDKCIVLHNTKFMHTTMPVAERASCTCRKHTNEILKLWCTQCKLFICPSCLSNDDQHSQHKEAIEPMFKVVQEARTGIETCLHQLDCIQLNFENLSECTVTAIQNQEEDYAKTRKDFNNQFLWLDELVEERKDTLNSELEDHQAVILSRLHHVEARIRQQLYRIKNRTESSRRILDTGNAIQLLETSQELTVVCGEASQNQRELASNCTTEGTQFVASLDDRTAIGELLKVFGKVERSGVKTMDCPILQQMIISQPTLSAQRFYTGLFVFGYRFRLTQPIRLKCVLIQSTYTGNITVSLYDEADNERKQSWCQSTNHTFKWNSIPMDGIELKNHHSLLVWSSDQQGSIGYQQGSSTFRQLNSNWAVAGVNKCSKIYG